MRRYARSLILIAFLVLVSGLVLGLKVIEIGDFKLGLDLQGGSHLVYRAVDKDTGEPITPERGEMDALKRSIEERVNASGLGEPSIQILGGDRLLIQLPGIRDLERAKGLIGETAQLEFKHRRLNIPRPLDEVSDADIVGVTVGPLPLPSEGEESPGAGPPGGAEGEGAAQEEPPAEPTSAEGDQPQGEESPETPEPQPQGPPVLMVEFTEEGAERFAGVVDRLIESLAANLAASADGRSPPPVSRLDISVEGRQPLRFEVTGLSIQRLEDTSRFAFSLPPIDQGDFPSLLEAARATLGESPSIAFTELQGKVDEDINLTGDDLARAFAGQNQQGGLPIVNIEFNQRGAKIFGELTQGIAGSDQDQIAIFLDDQELISPVVTTPILSGTAIIQGRDFTIQRVRDLALLLESGRLPFPIELIQERDVDATLGADSLKKSVAAGLVGLALVLLFMTLYYRAAGVFASLALLFYALFLLAIFKIIPLTLTLAGVAAIILSIGMAVDANILIFERMKDELRAGRTLLSAVNIGFNRAWPAIRDGNVSTLITCLILYWFGQRLGATVVQGFAASLAIGVVVSMFTAIVVSRTFLRVAATTRLARRLGLFVPSGGAELPQLQQREAAHAAQRR